jgi:hypothetical protein
MYLKFLTDGVEFPYSINKLKKENPTKSFAAVLSEEELLQYGVAVVRPVAEPSFDMLTQTCSTTVELIDEEWVQVWTVENLNQAVAEQNVRDRRNQLLSDSDWTQGKDVPENISTAWTTYRQALRDISTQEGFPYNVIWPSQP